MTPRKRSRKTSREAEPRLCLAHDVRRGKGTVPGKRHGGGGTLDTQERQGPLAWGMFPMKEAQGDTAGGKDGAGDVQPLTGH